MEDEIQDTLYISSNTFTFLHKEFWHSFVLYELYVGLSCWFLLGPKPRGRKSVHCRVNIPTP